ncbi:hypothetical protein GCM10010112_48290 [Actinoplanes lobatus]|uniref:DUF3068 domain-containing protein n=1 Tax=Actinoplanes lobatus TaxID=113568 RepID=A0A7W7HFV5_9ACTN|nr:DUF3068 domain-containing protein [Actinoplanes lobatus]MBB4749785.1 hypothetical protein [Actinoplanes lobatus]GGN76272.1 hypothetical protein GCM10010112_48290 [Actinoplanes lobatus]GIE38520.1 hypothetical protein Alo02nite_14180 [Actinoplanes lobatus]
MKSRVIGTVLFGFGVLALVFAGGLAFVVAPTVKQLPYDMEMTQSIAEAPNATYLQIADGKATIETGDLRSTVTVQTDSDETAKLTGDLDGTALVWVAGQQVENTEGELVSAYSTSLAVDRKTGAAVKWDGQWLDTGGQREAVDYKGQIYKFPFGTEQKTYDIFDRDILTAKPAKFIKTEEIQGVETYQFTQTLENETQVLPEDRVKLLLGQLLPTATSGSVQYGNVRTVWVDPVTGAYIKVQEQQKKTLLGNDGSSKVLLDATFVYSDATVTKSADTAKANQSKLSLVGVWGPIGLGVLGLILAVLGAVLMLRGSKTAAANGVPAQWSGAPRHAAKSGDEAGDEAEATASAEKS